MIHRFVHIGDAHVCLGPRRGDKEDAIWAIVTHGRKLAADGELAAWLVPGDLFDRESDIEDRNLWIRVFQDLLALAPVVGCYGNHDRAEDLYFLTALKGKYPVYLAQHPTVFSVPTATAGHTAIVAALPYPHKGGLVAAGVAPGEVITTAQQALDAILMDMAAEIETAAAQLPGAHAPRLAIGHWNIGGSITSTGQPSIGREIEFDPGLLSRLTAAGCGYIGLNHIHKHQELHGAVYAGSICRMDFGENEAKGFVVATYTDADLWIASTEGEPRKAEWSWAFHELDVPRQFAVECRFEAGVLVASDEFLEAKRQCAGSDVRVRYSFKRAEEELIDTDELTDFFANARTLKLEPVPLHEAEVRAPEIAAARTLEEKTRHYMARMQQPWTGGLSDKLSELQRPE